MLLGTLVASLLGNMLAGKGAIRPGEGTISPSKGATNSKERGTTTARQDF